MSGQVVDKRDSTALSIFYGNRSVLGTMRGKWVAYGVKAAYLYGAALDVLMSALSYLSLTQDPQVGPLPYPLEVAAQAVATLPLKEATWCGLLQEWAGITTSTVSPNQGDVVMLIDPDPDQLPKVVQNAFKVGAKVMVICDLGKPLPKSLFSKQEFSGSATRLTVPFLANQIDASVAHKMPERIIVTGNSLRVVTTALGALDHLCRHQGGKQLHSVLAQRIVVDSSSPVVSQSIPKDMAGILEMFGVAVCRVLPSGVNTGSERNAALILPIR